MAESPRPTVLTDKPTLRELASLRVVNWYEMGVALEVDHYDLECIETNYPADVNMRKIKMFTKWLKSDRPSYEELVKALIKVGKRNLAEEICKEKGFAFKTDNVHQKSSTSSDGRYEHLHVSSQTIALPPECVVSYAQHLKDRYKRMSVLPDSDWPPSIGRQYTRLAMIETERERFADVDSVASMERDCVRGNIDSIVARKTPIEFANIFGSTNPDQVQLKILMDGAPGVGKTTLTRKACVDWANGELLQQYHLVVLVPLRELRYRTSQHVEDLFPADSPRQKQEVIEHVQDTSGEHVLFIFDGYDELSLKERTQQSLYLDIIRGDKLCKSSVLVTSRPYASDNLQCLECINRHIEVLGFTEEQINSCIMINIPDNVRAAELIQNLKERSDITSLCYTPLNCGIMLYVYKQQGYKLPGTETELMNIFVVNSLKRHAKSLKDEKSAKMISDLTQLPGPLQSDLDALSKMAFDAVVQDKLVFSYHDLVTAFPEFPDTFELHLLSLMTSVKGFLATEDIHYQFVHTSIQEFLSARHVAVHFSKEEQLKFLRNHLRNKRFRLVLLFFAGLTKLDIPLPDLLKNEMIYKEIELKKRVILLSDLFVDGKSVAEIYGEYFLFLAHFIYESRRFGLYTTLLDALNEDEHFIMGNTLTLFDCTVLVQFLSQTSCPFKLLAFNDCSLNDQSVQIMCESIMKANRLFLSDNDITSNGAVRIFQSLEHNTCSLKEVNLSQNNLTKGSLNDEVGCALATMLAANVTLKKLKLDNCKLKDIECRHIAAGLAYNSSLKVLDLGNNEIEVEGMKAMAKAISNNKTLQLAELNVCLCCITDDAVKLLSQGLLQNTSLLVLDIGCNPEITGKGWATFFLSLHNSSLQKLSVYGNKLGIEGGEALAIMIAENKTLTKLNCRKCGIPAEIVETFSRSLLWNKTLELLTVDRRLEAEIENVIEKLKVAEGMNTSNWKLKMTYNSTILL